MMLWAALAIIAALALCCYFIYSYRKAIALRE